LWCGIIRKSCCNLTTPSFDFSVFVKLAEAGYCFLPDCSYFKVRVLKQSD